LARKEVISPVIDYRFEHQANTYKATAVPRHLEKLYMQVAEREGLTLAGFDFRVTNERRWYCLEVNPRPTFLPYEMATR
jgi:D-alanine-D-alanine ligase-like ATP-grasp enzyme